MKSKTLSTIYVLCTCLIFACSKNNDHTPDAGSNSLSGPIPKPTSGYGADGAYKVAEIDFPNPLYKGTNMTIFYPLNLSGARPVIFYSHPFGGEDKNYNRGLFEFIAKKGYALVFVPYPTTGVSVDERYNTLWAGFTEAAAKYPAVLDTQKVGFMGHSFGGGASTALAYRAFTEKGWGKNGRFIFTMAPWYSYQISTEQLQNFPANTQFITQVYEDDTVNDHRLAIDIFKNINIPNTEKDFFYMKSSVVSRYTYRADHTLPNSRSAYDAYDYYGIYRLLDALADYSFNNNTAAKNIALGNNSAGQVTMPGYGGQVMAPLEVTDDPAPRYPQAKYEFRCSDPANPGKAACD